MVNYNGQLLKSASPPQRAAQYGDGLFETIRMFNGKLPFWPAHWYRLQQGLRVLKINLPKHYTADFFQKEIMKLMDDGGNIRIRLTIWRSGEGLYTSENNNPIFLIEHSALSHDFFPLNENGLHVGIYRENHLPTAKKATKGNYYLPNIKTCNALPFVLANIYRKENKLDDIILLNTSGGIACGGSSNVFLWKKGRLITPTLSQGCIAGTMRSAIIEQCKKLKIDISEEKILRKNLREADGIFLTNAISGIRWIKSIKGIKKEFEKEKSPLLLAEINRQISGY